MPTSPRASISGSEGLWPEDASAYPEGGHPNPLSAVLEALYRRQTFGIKPGLDPIRRLCTHLGNPQEAMGIVHVAGTNGKGSVCAIIEAVLRTAGLRVGLYTSPHMVRFHERIRINGKDIDDASLATALAQCEESAGISLPGGHQATFFEMATAAALLAFRQAGISIAVLETGMGGRWDATNIVTPLLSVITRVAMDHEAYLGNTLEAVAREKAGIIKDGRPVVISPQDPSAEAILRQAAIGHQASLVMASDAVSVRPMGNDLHGQRAHIETAGGWSGVVHLPLTGTHQLENLATAVCALERLSAILDIPLTLETVRNGLNAVRWRGRLECLREHPLVLADAAHNPSGAATLADALRSRRLTRCALVTGMCADKDAAGVVRRLSPVIGPVWTVPIPNPRSLSPYALAALYQQAGRRDVQALEHVPEALQAAESWARTEASAVVIAGSIFLLGEVLPYYDATPDPHASGI